MSFEALLALERRAKGLIAAEKFPSPARAIEHQEIVGAVAQFGRRGAER